MVCIYGESEITHISKQYLVNLLSAEVLTHDAWSQREKISISSANSAHSGKSAVILETCREMKAHCNCHHSGDSFHTIPVGSSQQREQQTVSEDRSRAHRGAISDDEASSRHPCPTDLQLAA